MKPHTDQVRGLGTQGDKRKCRLSICGGKGTVKKKKTDSAGTVHCITGNERQ